MAERVVRIFLASPSADTGPARQAVVATIRELQVDDEFADRLRIDLLRWDDEMRAVMCEADHNPQIDIGDQIGHPRTCDLLIGLFAHTMGGKLPEDEPFGRRPDGELWHCTEWEVSQALEGKRQGAVKSVWRFRDKRRQPDPPEDLTTDEELAYRKRSIDVRGYLEGWKKRGEPMKQGYQLFADEEDLARQLRTGLRPWLRKHFLVTSAPLAEAIPAPREDRRWLDDPLNPDQQALLDALCTEPDTMPPPDAARLALAERVLVAPVRGLRGYLLRRYACWCSTEGGRLDRRFVRLTLLVHRGPEAQGDPFQQDGDRGRFDRLSDLLERHADVQGWVLVGEPGTGKSTLLQHHELSTARAVLRALVADRDETLRQRPEICIWQRLSDYDADRDRTPGEWLAAQWQAQWQEALPPLAEVGRHVRVRWVLDGFNEIGHQDDAQYEAAASQWRRWLGDWSASQALPQPAPLLSVRTREQADLGKTVRRIDIEQWNDEQMRLYCRQRFLTAPDDPAADDPPLWLQLSRRDQAPLREMCRLPFHLAAQCTLFLALGRPARHRAELISGLVWLGLIRDLDKAHLGATGLLSRHDRRRLIEVRDRGWGRESDVLIPPCEGRLLPWLDRQAEWMHAQGLSVSVSRGQVLQALAGESGPPQAEQWLEALLRLGWWNHSGIDRRTGQPTLRFTHQLWQEFFAARHLCDRLDAPQAELPDLSPPTLPDLQEAMATLAVRAPLLGPRANHWEEAIRTVLLFDHQDAVAWLDAVRGVNLPMAGRVAAGKRPSLEADVAGRRVLKVLRDDLLTRSRDPAVDVRLRIEAGLALGELGDPRYEERVGPHGRYLWPKPEHWVSIPGGDYTIGSNDGPRFEGPETPVTLQRFEMAFAPVTNAEFRCFVEAGGYRQIEWWDDPLARQWLKEGLRNEREIQRLQAMVDEARIDFDAFASQYNWTPANRQDWREFAGKSQAEVSAQLEEWYGANGKGYTEPQEWQNPAFNAAAQPVVGVCFFEVMAYAKWLSAQAELPLGSVRPPLEAEWEVAARGGLARRRWPWVGPDPEPGRINDGTARLQRTSPVGVFPRSDTPDGLVDMAGNVWEWTISEYIEEPNRHNAKALVAPTPVGPARRVVRGGSWLHTTGRCRASYRDRFDPDNRYLSLGLRLVRRRVPHSEPCSPDHRASDATPSR